MECDASRHLYFHINLLNHSPSGDLIQHKFEPHKAHATILKTLPFNFFKMTLKVFKNVVHTQFLFHFMISLLNFQLKPMLNSPTKLSLELGN